VGVSPKTGSGLIGHLVPMFARLAGDGTGTRLFTWPSAKPMG